MTFGRYIQIQIKKTTLNTFEEGVFQLMNFLELKVVFFFVPIMDLEIILQIILYVIGNQCEQKNFFIPDQNNRIENLLIALYTTLKLLGEMNFFLLFKLVQCILVLCETIK